MGRNYTWIHRANKRGGRLTHGLGPGRRGRQADAGAGRWAGLGRWAWEAKAADALELAWCGGWAGPTRRRASSSSIPPGSREAGGGGGARKLRRGRSNGGGRRVMGNAGDGAGAAGSGRRWPDPGDADVEMADAVAGDGGRGDRRWRQRGGERRQAVALGGDGSEWRRGASGPGGPAAGLAGRGEVGRRGR